MPNNQPPQQPGNSDQPANSQDDDRGYEVPTRTWMVHGGIIVAFGLFFSIVMLLFVRWWGGTHEPTSSLDFVGNDLLDGVVVRVDGTNLNSAAWQKLSKENGYEVKFTVPAGVYLVRITRNGEPLVQDSSLPVPDSKALKYDLTRVLSKSTTEPTSQP